MFKAYLSTDNFIDKGDGVIELDSEVNESTVSTRVLGEFKTIDKAKQAIYNCGRLQDFFSASFIESEDGDEVASSVPVVKECPCCGNQKWDRVEVGF